MTKTIMALAIAFALVIGTIGTATIAYAGGDDDGGVLQTLLCPAGKALTGIVSGGGDDDDGGGILDLICDADIAALQDKDMQLMDKDMQLMDEDVRLQGEIDRLDVKDMALMDKDMALMDEDTRLQGEIDTISLTPGPKGDKGDKGDTGSQGPKGDKGDKGDPGTGGGGSIGTLQTQIVTSSCKTSSNSFCTATATCPSGTLLTGGYSTFSGNQIILPEDLGPGVNSWNAKVQSDSFGATFATASVKAICGKVIP